MRATRAHEMRPTTDTVRRTIFDILQNRVADARVLDLFAGAGTLGIEALSRGARQAMFVERDRSACAVIVANLRSTGLHDRATVRCADALRFLSRPATTPFDLAFLDPPYGRGLPFVGHALGLIASGGWLRPGGTVVVEAEVGHFEWPPRFSETRTRRFGRTRVRMAVVDGEAAEGDLSRNV